MSTRKQPNYIHDQDKDKINISEFIPLHFEKFRHNKNNRSIAFYSEENIAHRKKREPTDMEISID